MVAAVLPAATIAEFDHEIAPPIERIWYEVRMIKARLEQVEQR